METGNYPTQQEQQQQRPQECSEGLGGVQHQPSQVAGEQIVSKGDIFGEGCLLPGAAGLHRREKASAVSIVSAYVLKATALQDIAEEYPEVCGLPTSMKPALTVPKRMAMDLKVNPSSYSE